MSQSVLWHAQSKTAVVKHLRASLDGLSKEEISKRQKKEGANVLPTIQPDAWWMMLFRQLFNPLIVVLLIAAGVSMVLRDVVDVGVILAAVILNTIIGFIQEWKASRALLQLQSFIQPKALVRRNHVVEEISAQDLVPGDVLLFQTGDQVTADVRVLEAVELQVNEASLTGESFPVTKQGEPLPKGTVLAERTNMMFAGTTVVSGHGVGVVTTIGRHTEIGRIADLLSTTTDAQTPLQKQLGHLARWIGLIVVGLVIGLFFLGIVSGRGIVEMFEMSVALAVAAIPEGLTVAVTIVLAIGMQRILKHKALVRRLVAAETLGSVSVICSDKTGTLTEGNMQVVSVYTLDGMHDVQELRGATHRGAIKHVLEALILCNDAQEVQGTEGEVIRGSVTERALFSFAREVGMDPVALRKTYPILADLPFDSVRKYRLTEFASDGAWKFLLIGAPQVVFEACRFTKQERVRLEEEENTLTKKGLRLVAVAQKPLRHQQETIGQEDLHGFRFLGLVVLQDPLRPEVSEQIASARQAGIRTVIVTGDHPQTAQTIAQQAGLSVRSEQVLIGTELDQWSDEELKRRIARIHVFARVEPRHKIRIVRAWQERGEVVAMTGDGVNDAPALKAADIGIALGSGTEVAKQAADLVLLDNRFSTITAAIEQGRVMFENIRKSTVYLMADSFTEMILIAGSLLFGFPIPLLPIQILWINLVADSLPNVGLTFEAGENDVMQLPPRPREEPVLNKEMLTIIFTIGIVTDLVLFGLYAWLLSTHRELDHIRSIMFAAVGIDSLIYIFAVKSFRKTIFQINLFSNLWLIGGILIGFMLMLFVLLHPFLREVFEVSPLSLSEWGLLLMMGALKLVGIELVKGWFIIKRTRQHV